MELIVVTFFRAGFKSSMCYCPCIETHLRSRHVCVSVEITLSDMPPTPALKKMKKIFRK